MGDFAIVVTGTGDPREIRLAAERLVNELTDTNVSVRSAEAIVAGSGWPITPKAPI